MILDFPLKKHLFEALKTEYLLEARTKGNSWRDMKLGDLFIKWQEETDEIQELINNGNIHSEEILREIIDSILVSFMLYEVLYLDQRGLYKE